MKKITKRLLLAALILIVLGIGVFAGCFSVLGFDTGKLGAGAFETNTHAVDEAFESISVRMDTADLTLVPSEDGTCRVTCKEYEKLRHDVRVENGVLVIEATDTQTWFEKATSSIGLFSGFHSPSVTVCLPAQDYERLQVQLSTGDVKIPADFRFGTLTVKGSTGDVSCGASVEGRLEISVSTGSILAEGLTASEASLRTSTGRVTLRDTTVEGALQIRTSTGGAALTDVNCGSLKIECSTGSIRLKNVLAEDKLEAETDTGDIRLDSCDAGSLSLETDTGDVTGSLRTEKVFYTSTDTGSVDVPRTVSGGLCEIDTDTGDIHITIG